MKFLASGKAFYNFQLLRNSHNINSVLVCPHRLHFDQFGSLGNDILDRVNGRSEPHDGLALWPNKTVVYYLDKSVGPLVDEIRYVMHYIEMVTCLKFKERTKEKHFIHIYSGEGCTAPVGFYETVLPVSLNVTGCKYRMYVAHELLHVIGLEHMHTHPDRDKFLKIHWDNIVPSEKIWFQKDNKTVFKKFDYHSIMLYGPKAFARAPDLITMSTRIKGRPLFDPRDKGGLSRGDVSTINALYECKKSLKLQKPCSNCL